MTVILTDTKLALANASSKRRLGLMDPLRHFRAPVIGKHCTVEKKCYPANYKRFQQTAFCILTLYRLAPIHIKGALARRGPVDRIKSILQIEQEHFAREITADRTFWHVREDGNMAQSRKF